MKPKSLLAVVLIGLSLTTIVRAQDLPAGGIGVDMGIWRDEMRVIHVHTNTPAAKAGLLPGLAIRSIDGVSTEGKSLKDCTKMMRGAVGSKVKLELVDTDHNKTNTVELVRADLRR